MQNIPSGIANTISHSQFIINRTKYMLLHDLFRGDLEMVYSVVVIFILPMLQSYSIH